MKTVKVTADNVVSIIDVDFDDFRDIQRAVGGHFEPVHAARMAKVFRPDIIMLVDEDGLMKGLPVNMLGLHSVRDGSTWKSNRWRLDLREGNRRGHCRGGRSGKTEELYPENLFRA